MKAKKVITFEMYMKETIAVFDGLLANLLGCTVSEAIQCREATIKMRRDWGLAFFYNVAALDVCEEYYMNFMYPQSISA